MKVLSGPPDELVLISFKELTLAKLLDNQRVINPILLV